MARLRHTVAPFNHPCLTIMTKNDVALQATILPVCNRTTIFCRRFGFGFGLGRGFRLGHAAFPCHAAIPRTPFGRFVTRTHATHDKYHRTKQHFITNFHAISIYTVLCSNDASFSSSLSPKTRKVQSKITGASREPPRLNKL